MLIKLQFRHFSIIPFYRYLRIPVHMRNNGGVPREINTQQCIDGTLEW